MYRVKLKMIDGGLGLLIADRDVARLCLGEGDELVIAEVVRHPAGGCEAEGEAPEPAPRRPGRGNPAPTLSERPEQTERDKSAFRNLAR